MSGSPPHSGQASTHLQSVMAGANAQLGWHLVVYQAVSRGRPARTHAVDIRRVSGSAAKGTACPGWGVVLSCSVTQWHPIAWEAALPPSWVSEWVPTRRQTLAAHFF